MLKKLKNKIFPVAYCNEVISAYVEKLRDDIFIEQDKREWMRPNLLRGGKYKLDNGKYLHDYVFNKFESVTGKEIIFIEGESGTGKNFVSVRVLSECASTIMKVDMKNSIGMCKKKEFRIPIFVSEEDIKCFLRDCDNQKWEVEDLFIEVFEKKGICSCGDATRNVLKKCLKKYLQYGRFVVFFEEGCLKHDMYRIFRGGRIYKNYKENAIYHNIVLVPTETYKNRDLFSLQKSEYITFGLNKLSEEEIRDYIGNYDEVRQMELNDDFIRILQLPERLRMFELLKDRKYGEKKEKIQYIKTEVDFYYFYIITQIEQILYSKNRYDVGRAQYIFGALAQYAYELVTCGEKKLGKIIIESANFDRNEFCECGILDSNFEFQFVVCKYYMAAEYMYNKLVKEKKFFEVPPLLYEDPQEKVLIYLSQKIQEESIFKIFWNSMVNNQKHRILLLAKILNNSILGEKLFYCNQFCKCAVDNLERDFYDYSVMESFEELKEKVVEYLKSQYSELMDKDEKAKNNIKRRIVYYLGISKRGITDTIINELMEEDTEQHLRYHIIRAMVENCNTDVKSKEIIEEMLVIVGRYCSACEDPLIKSDYDVLYRKITSKDWLQGFERSKNSNEVISYLDSSYYWQRAHAAGALGRKGDNDAPNIILNRIKKELQWMYEKQEGYLNCIKVISYSIEALCEMSDLWEVSKRNEVIRQLVNCLDNIRNTDEAVSDAYATIATGIEYIMNPDREKLHFNLGGCFRNHTISYEKVLQKVLGNVMEREEDNNKKIELEKKLIQLRDGETGAIMKSEHETKDEFEILQISDIHAIDSNIDDQMIVDEIIEYFKNVKLILVTGDLHQYGEDYSKALEVLNKFVERLGISKTDVIMVPGNHDSEEIEGKKDSINDIRENIYTDAECYKKHEDKLYSCFGKYEKFLEEFYGIEDIQLGGIHNILHLWDNGKFGILLLNTSFVSDDNSDAKRIVNLQEIQNIKNTGKYPVIAIGHHDFYKIYQEHQNYLKAFFRRYNVSAYLCGDEHQIDKKDIDLGRRTIPNIVAGKMIGTMRDKWSDRAVIWYKVNLKDNIVTVKPYYWNKAHFSDVKDFAKLPKGPEEEIEDMTFNLIIE